MDGRPVTSTLVRRVVGFPGASERVIDLGHLLVADADPDPAPRRRDELSKIRAARRASENDDLWTELEGIGPLLTEEWASTWRVATLALLAVDHPWYRIDELTGGALHRRLDAIYDAFDTDFCAHEVQACYWKLVEGLVEAGQSAGPRALKVAVSLGRGAAGAATTPRGVPIATPWATDTAAGLAKQGHRPAPCTFEIALIALLWTLLPEGERGRGEAEELMVERCQREFRDLGDRGDDDPRVLRMWRSMLSMMGGDLDEGSVMPDVTGKPLDEATSLAETLGLNVTTVDGGESPLVAGLRRGADRSVWDPSRWRVVAQVPMAGSTVHEGLTVLAIAKHGEQSVNPAFLDAMLLDRFTELAGPDDDARG